MAQFLVAADRDGTLMIGGRAELELVALWFFPIVLGTVVLAVLAARRGARWTDRETDEPVSPPSAVSQRDPAR